jgi:hypothetical protein
MGQRILLICHSEHTSSPRMNLSVRVATNTQVIRSRHPSVIFTNASFKMGRTSRDAICRMCSVVRSLLGSHLVMSRLAIITNDLVSMVTRHDVSPIHPLEFRLSWPCFANVLHV